MPIRKTGFDKMHDDVNFVDKMEIAEEQIENMKLNRNYIASDYEELGFKELFDNFIDKALINDTVKMLKKEQLQVERKNDASLYMVHQEIYSALISADKMSASGTMLPEIKFADFKMMKQEKDKMFEGSKGFMNDIRNDIFECVQKKLKQEYKKSRLFSITSPTGTGKTYTGFFAAEKLNDLLGGRRKIVYALPFTSIIDQNFKSICSIYKDADGFENGSSQYIIKHHNLSNVDYKSEDTNYNRCSSEILIENWESGVIVTTFVQLLETLIGNKNRMLKKLISLKGSIVLLDEVQAIPIEYYGLVEFILKQASEKLNLRVIMMTATKPMILKDAIELLDNCESYFSKFNRTNLILDKKPCRIEDFMDRYEKDFENKSALIICNTISESLEIYNIVKETGRKVYYLSTNLIPIHRRERIKEIRQKLKAGEKIITVSTQVVEAGVDFDFDMVIRDIGPLDSIIQAAGRCNRNNLRPCSNVDVVIMTNEKGQRYADFVYGKTIINLTFEALEKHDFIEEKDFYDVINEYFKKVTENKNQDDSEKFINSIKKLHFWDNNDYCIGKFSLIKNNPTYIDVYLQVDDEAENVYKQFIDTLNEKDIGKKREKYLNIKNKIRDYMISIPYKFKNVLSLDEYGMINLPRDGCSDYYNNETGFIRQKDDDFMVI